MTQRPAAREIPFNYTSADDRQAVSELLGPAIWGAARGAPRTAGDRPERPPADAVLRRDPRSTGATPTCSRSWSSPPGDGVGSSAHIETDLAIVEGNARGERAGARGAGALPGPPRRLPAGGGGDARAPAADPAASSAPIVGPDGVLLRPLHAGLARHRRHRLAPAPAAGGGHAGRRGPGGAAAGRHRPAGALRHPARRRHRAHRRRGAAPARLRGGEHRAAGPHPGRRAAAPSRGGTAGPPRRR